MTEPSAAIYGLGVYGLDVYGYEQGDELNAALTATCSSYAQVDLAWGYPAGTWSQMAVVRNTAGHPRDTRDGVTIPITVLDFSYADTDVAAGQRYYYSAFLLIPSTQEWVRAGDAMVLVPRDYGYLDLLWARIPRIHRQSPQLRDFLSIFAYELDALRTDLDSLLSLPVAGLAAVDALPAYLGHLGFTVEPELRNSVTRRLIANAAHLYAGKGTLAALENLASILTGWDVTVRTGYNRMLDNLDTLTETSLGRWDTQLLNCNLSIRTDEDFLPSRGNAYAVMQSSQPGHMSASTATVGDIARLNGIPVLPGLNYTASAYIRGALNARIVIDWYDAAGQLIDTSIGVTVAGGDSNWTTRVLAGGIAPATTATAAPRIVADVLAPGEELLVNGVQFEEASDARPWQPARQILFVMRADLVNEIVNPDGTNGLQGWSTAGLTSTPDGFSYAWEA